MEKLRFDTIVVGSGPGGATVAKELTDQGQSVLILEWGGNAPLNGSPVQGAQMIGIPGKSMLLTHRGLIATRGITTGGSSILYCGTAFEPPHEMLQRYGVNIKNEAAQTRNELPIGKLDDSLMGTRSNRIMESAQDLGYAWDKLDKYIYQDKCRKNCDRCYFGCPHGAKWSARNYVEESVANGARLIPHAKVTRVLLENNKAIGVEFQHFGKKLTANADRVVLGAGGIGTPVILRKTGIPEAGYDYFFDPLITVMGQGNETMGKGEVPMSAGIHLEEDGYMMTDMTFHHMLYEAFSAQVMRFDRLFSFSKSMMIMVKGKDSLGGRLTDSGGVRKVLAKNDEKKLLHGYDRAKGILKNAGAKNIYKTWYVAAHPGGTAKIGEVVDSNLQTKFDNLYVCDCSVIPEAWGVPPTLTLISLGKRLAAHLGAISGHNEKTAA